MKASFAANGRNLALLAGSAGVLFAALQMSGTPPVDVLTGLAKGSMGSPAAWSGTLRETAPLLLAGVAVMLGLRAGLFNIGVEGQLLVGALTCAVTAIHLPGAGGLLAGLVTGALGGALWAAPAGLIKAYRGGHEVITTIMLNSIAALFTASLVTKVFRDPTQQSVTTSYIAQRMPMATPGAVEINAALVAGLLAALWLAWWLRRTVAGYELMAVGENPVAAEFAGIDRRVVQVKAMLMSGALAGLAGALQVAAVEHRYYDGFSPGYGFDALGVALLAGAHPLALVPSALLFGVLEKGGSAIQILGVPKGIVGVVLGVVIVVSAAFRTRKGGGDHG